ncbi:TPA: restriction endonuclease subunit S [Enterococcus faecium]|nr:restriction endonuclease subunit S [Enterococcus faecium]
MSNDTQPEIRFPGFTDDWEERKLGDEVRIVMGQSPNSENYTDDPNDYILVQGNADMKNGRVFPRVWTTQVTKQAEKDDLILSVRAPVGDIGKTAYDVVIGRGVAAIKGNEFIFQNLGKMKSDGYWTRYSTGSTFESINSTDIKEAIISVPTIEEQNKIGSFFKQLDNTIALHQRKLDLLKETKKGFLQKMFPENGAKVPEVRFPGFTEDWEERKFGLLFEKNLEKNKNSEFDASRTISIATMHFKEEGNGAAESSLATYKVLRVGDIAYEGHTSKQFAFGRFVLNDIGDGIMSPRFTTLRPTSERPISFWKQYIHYEPIMRHLLVRSTKNGTMMNELVIPDLEKESLLVPSESEQKQIGAFFDKLDETITLHQRKLDLLKETKKGFLQKMFV